MNKITLGFVLVSLVAVGCKKDADRPAKKGNADTTPVVVPNGEVSGLPTEPTTPGTTTTAETPVVPETPKLTADQELAAVLAGRWIFAEAFCATEESLLPTSLQAMNRDAANGTFALGMEFGQKSAMLDIENGAVTASREMTYSVTDVKLEGNALRSQLDTVLASTSFKTHYSSLKIEKSEAPAMELTFTKGGSGCPGGWVTYAFKKMK